jgi:hypothetical protein
VAKMPKRLEWRISEKASLPTSTEAPCQKIYIFFKNFEISKFRKLKKKIVPAFLGSFFEIRLWLRA